jgi:periplasmic protein TonB
MELKKSEKADLENKKGIFLQIGLIFSLAVTLVAFEWKSYDTEEYNTYSTQRFSTEVEEMAPITQQYIPPPLPVPPLPSIALNIVENTARINDDISIDAEADESTQVDEYKSNTVIQQEDESEVKEQEIFLVVENVPVFPGGDLAMKKFLMDNIRYPVMANQSGIQGTVHVTFVVERDGSVTDVRILRGIGGGCDEEALRVVRNMPRWEPGRQRGKPVRVQYHMPIKFTLSG